MDRPPRAQGQREANVSRDQQQREARAVSWWWRMQPRARVWWLLGAGGAIVAGAVIAIVVTLLATSDDEKVDEELLAPADAHSIGAPDAPVTVVVFSSFTCPVCTLLALGSEQEIIANYVGSGKVRIVHRIIAGSGESELAAEAVECAGAQGSFQEYYWALFENWVNPDPVVFSLENLKRFAANVGLDVGELAACVESREYALHIRHEREAAGELGVEYTPTVFINGEKLVGLMGYEVYQEAIEKALAETE